MSKVKFLEARRSKSSSPTVKIIWRKVRKIYVRTQPTPFAGFANIFCWIQTFFGQVVSMLTFYSDNPSSNPSEVHSFIL